ncbi:MAG TPA: permease, partial [Alphaproteobacteria bacterium]|nr:permease [Alphaproteobacteria bacterium]
SLITPWLGDDFTGEGMPLPGLISLTLNEDGASRLPALESDLKELVPHMQIDRHETWLDDVLSLTGTLQFSAFLILLIIGFTTITAVAGAVRSRMAEHRKEVELLHLMGANDLYIMKQFRRHAIHLCMQGGAAGVIFAALILMAITLLAGGGESGLLPDFNFSPVHVGIFAALPLVVAAIGGIAARVTVLRALARMP